MDTPTVTLPAAHSELDHVSIARHFMLPEPIEVDDFTERGNINLHTYLVRAAGEKYLMQKVNMDVFSLPHRVMSGMLASIGAQAAAKAAGKGDPLWEPIRLIPTREGDPYLTLADGDGADVWRMMVWIPDTVSYKSLADVPGREAQLRLAAETGRGLALYSDLTDGIDVHGIDGSLPGYRNTALYYAQFHAVTAGKRTLEEVADHLPEDPVVREGTERLFLVALPEAEATRRLTDPTLADAIALIRECEPNAMRLWSAIEDGTIRPSLIHGDTKIENFLFDRATGAVKALVDLDTIMPFTWLADWGDLLRSMVNVAGEKADNVNAIQVDADVYEAVTRGFLSTATHLTDAEISLMPFAVEAITLELGLRFLTDYLRGDTYFQLAPGDRPDLNKVRGVAQLTLYRRLVEFRPQAEAIATRYRR